MVTTKNTSSIIQTTHKLTTTQPNATNQLLMVFLYTNMMPIMDTTTTTTSHPIKPNKHLHNHFILKNDYKKPKN